MRPLIAIILSTLPALAPVPMAAADTAEKLTPEAAVALALRHHPGVAVADRELAAAEADRSLARTGYLPRLDLTEDYTRSTNPVFVFASKLGQEIFGPADFAIDSLNHPDAFTNYATRVGLRQSVWDGGRTHLGSSAAGWGVAAVSDSRHRTREEIAFGAVRAFWDAALADRMLEVALSAEEAALANRDLAAQQVEAGMSVPSDRMSAQVRLAEVRAMRIRSEQAARVARAALRVALGISDDRDFDLAVPKSGTTEEEKDEDPAAQIDRALSSRADLRSLDARIQQAGAGVKLARSRLLPEIGVGAQVEWNDDVPFGSQGRNWTAGASLRLSLFDGLETRARVARARADRERLEAMREAMAEGIRLEVRSAWADRSSAARRLQVAESALSQSEEALRIVRERYSEGMAVMVELLGAEAARTAAQGNRAAAARDLAVAAAALNLAAGREVLPESAGREGGAGAGTDEAEGTSR